MSYRKNKKAIANWKFSFSLRVEGLFDVLNGNFKHIINHIIVKYGIKLANTYSRYVKNKVNKATECAKDDMHLTLSVK